jgi:hypothetical protein
MVPAHFANIVEVLCKKKPSSLQSYNSEPISIALETAVRNRRLHRKAALTTIHKAFTLRTVDDRKDWFK